MSADVTEPIRMVFTLPIHFYTNLDLKREIKKIIIGYPRPGFAKMKTINVIFWENMKYINRLYLINPTLLKAFETQASNSFNNWIDTKIIV